jgi:hypothetical protein
VHKRYIRPDAIPLARSQQLKASMTQQYVESLPGGFPQCRHSLLSIRSASKKIQCNAGKPLR